MESEREFYIKKICEALNAATLEEIKILYAAVVAFIGAE